MNKNLLIFLYLPLFVIFFFFSGCSSKDEKIEAKVTFLTESKDIKFTNKSEELQTLAFHSTVPWKILELDASWVEITPMNGDAGNNELSIKLLKKNSTIKRQAIAILVAGSTQESFYITFTPIKEDVAAENIVLLQKKEKVLKGKSVQLTAKVEPEETTDQIVWTSSNNDIASVDPLGVVTGVNIGKATITASAGEVDDICEIEVVEKYATGGDGRTYTFEALSQIPSSNVTLEEGSYVVNTDFEVSEGDILKVQNKDLIKLKDKVSITIKGKADFAPTDTATITRYDESAVPKNIYLTGAKGGGTFKNISFVDVPIRLFAQQSSNFENCSFKDISSKNSAITIASPMLTTIKQCFFLNNSYPAISNDPKLGSPILFENNYIYKNSNTARNRPQINIGPGGDNGEVKLINNTVIGPGEETTCGGIAISNLLGVKGANKVLIEKNTVTDCRYGITTTGPMYVEYIKNTIKNNRYDPNPMTGGSGISISSQANGQVAKLTGNFISGHLWGVTIIGNIEKGTGPDVNLGNLSEGKEYNPGLNEFKDNGNGGKLYDLYNNSAKDVYAQGNKWNVAVQDEMSIEDVITHKKDDSNLGEVFFIPAGK